MFVFLAWPSKWPRYEKLRKNFPFWLPLKRFDPCAPCSAGWLAGWLADFAWEEYTVGWMTGWFRVREKYCCGWLNPAESASRTRRWCFWVKAYDLLFRDWWIARENVILSDSCQFVAVIYIFRTISILSRIHSCIVFFFLSFLAWSELSICTYAEVNNLTNADLYILQC